MPFIRSFFNWTFLELLLKSSGSQNLQVANRPSNVLTKIDLDHPCFFYPKTKLSIFIVARQIFSPIFFWAAVKEQILEWQVLLNLSLKVAGLEPVTSWLWANFFVVLASGLCPLTAFVKKTCIITGWVQFLYCSRTKQLNISTEAGFEPRQLGENATTVLCCPILTRLCHSLDHDHCSDNDTCGWLN